MRKAAKMTQQGMTNNTAMLVKKLKFRQELSHLYNSVDNSKELYEMFNRMLNGNDLTFFKGDNSSWNHVDDLVKEYERLRPKMVIDVDNHISRFRAITNQRTQ